mgnify:FL=1
MVAGDFNADGKDDIAALYDYGGGTCQMHVFLTNSAGTEVEGGYWQTWYACTTAGYYYANQVTGRMVAGDFNGDGKDDIAAMYDYGDNKAQLHYLLTNSTVGGFDSTAWHVSEMNTNYNAALVQWRMVSGDYDGDGKDDIAALYDYTYYDATDSGQVQVFRSTGTDFASKEWWYYGGKRAYDASKTAGLVSADYNGDGKAEIHALYDMGSGQANVYEFRKKEDFALDRFALVTDARNSYAVLVEDENAASGLLESVTNGTNAAIRYTYDGNGNITEIHEGTQLKARYAYDSLNQLIREDNAYTGKTVTYTYDAGGNILGKTEYTYTTGELGSPTRSVVYGYTDSTWKDLLTSYDGTAITYDEIGNPLNWRGGMSFTWQNGRQLAGISKDGLTASYAYNDSGIRLRKTVNGVETRYFLNGSLILSEITGDVQTDYYYDESGNVFGFKRGDSEYYYIRNGQGDIIGILDSSGTQIVSYVYDSWGKLVSVTDASGNDKSGDASFIGNLNPFRYRGYYYDTESGLYYLQSRYYDPEVGRFINADAEVASVGESVQGYNLFAYCFNNPVNLFDENGNWPSWAKKLVAAVAVVAVVTVVAAVTVATAGAGTAVAAVAVGAAKGAAIGLVTGAATGAATGYLATGTLEGTLNGMADGALSGSITGAVTGGIQGGMSYTPKPTAATTPSSGACFVQGTAVLTSTGLVAIEKLRSGDRVWAENPETGERALKEVVQTFVRETDELIHISVLEEEIIATAEHPFYVPQKGWTSAVQLRAGDILVLNNGKYVTVEKVQHEFLEVPVKVYNFEVQDFHTYYVGRNSVLVHNACSVPKSTPKLTKSTGVKNTPDQNAVIQLAKENRKGLSMENAKTLVEWAKEYNLPGNPRIDMGHPGRGIVSQSPHAHIGPVNHIPIF